MAERVRGRAEDLHGWSADALRDEARSVGVELGDGALARCEALYREVLEARLNVTSILEATAFRQQMVVDSLSCLRSVQLQAGDRFIDVGSGGGFPGLPVAIARPDVRVVLIEAAQRKCAFLERLVARIGAGNAEVVCARAEDVARSPTGRDSAAVVAARALAPLSDLLELTAPLCAVEGHVVAMKGPRADEELKAAARASGVLCLRLVAELRFTLPGGHERILLTFRKVAPTPARFPRRPAARARTPL